MDRDCVIWNGTVWLVRLPYEKKEGIYLSAKKCGRVVDVAWQRKTRFIKHESATLVMESDFKLQFLLLDII